MNPRQRRGLILILVSALVAVGTFIAVSSYVQSVNSQVGERVTVYRATKAIDPYTPLSASNLEAFEVPKRWTADSSVVTLRELEGRRVGFRVNTGSIVSSDMLIPSSALSPTEREIAINIDPVTGVAGRVRPGDRVDIYSVFGDVPGLPKSARVLARDIRVVSIAGQQTVTQRSEEGTEQAEVVPVTLAVEPETALAVTYAASFADSVRLVALPTDVGTNRKGETDTFDAKKLGGKAVLEGNQ